MKKILSKMRGALMAMVLAAGLPLLAQAQSAQSYVMAPKTDPLGGLAFQGTGNKGLEPLYIDGFGFVRMAPYAEQADDFTGRVLDTSKWHVTVGSSASASIIAAQGGVVSLSTAASATPSTTISQISGARVFNAGNGNIAVEARVALQNTTDTVAFVGFVDTNGLVVPMQISATSTIPASFTTTVGTANLVGLVYDTASTVSASIPALWRPVAVKDTVSVTTAYAPTASSANVVQGAYRTLRVNVDPRGNAGFYIDGKRVGSFAGYVSTTAQLAPYIGITSRAAAAKTLHADYLQAIGQR